MATDPKNNEIKDEKLEDVSGGKTRPILDDGGEEPTDVGGSKGSQPA